LAARTPRGSFAAGTRGPRKSHLEEANRINTFAASIRA
jgi:hypothetical protein